MRLRKPEFTFSAYRPFAKNKEKYKNLKKQETMIYLSKRTK